MKSHIAYRVQHSDDPTSGPFQGFHSIGYEYSVPITDEHPSIVIDSGFSASRFPFGLVCGCETMEMLCHWFNTVEWIKALHDAGFHIAVYVVPDDEYHRTKSGTQVAFFNHAEYLVETHSVLKLLDIL